MYRNGYLMNPDMTAVTNLAGTQTNTNRSISIGSRVDGTNYFTGFMHSASYWSEALTQGAIRQIWNQGCGSTFNLNIGVEDYGPSVSGTPSTPYNVRTLEAWWQLGKDLVSPVKDWTNNGKDLAPFEVEETMPTGMIVPFGGSVAPAGYLMCDGSEVDRSTYAALYAAIGDAYGNGNGVDTFNVPNAEGRMPQGRDPAIIAFAFLGNAGGEKKVTLDLEEIPSHVHTLELNNSAGTNSNTVRRGDNTVANDTSSAPMNPAGGNPSEITVSHNNMSPYFVTNYIIQT
jgi:microcystin-dependent protein